MPIEFRCTQCQRLLRTGDATAGKQARCPECGTVMTVPSPGGAPGPSLAETLAAGEAPPAGPLAGPPPAPPAGPPGPMPGEPPPEGPVSPFAEAAMPPAAPLSSENPYASPTSFTTSAGPPLVYGDLQMYALSRVTGPATALIVTGWLGLGLDLFRVLTTVADLGVMGARGAGPRGDDWAALAMFGGMGLAGLLVSIVLCILVIVGAMKMKALENHGFALASAIIALLPCGPCCLLGIPFGIWAIVVLSDGQVRAAFRS